MRLSRNYTHAIEEEGKDYDSINHALLTQAGFIDQTASGIYTLLPPGTRVLQKIENIIRQELNAIDAEEIMMPSLIPKALFDQSRNWGKVDVLYQIASRYGFEYGLAFSAEEVISSLMQKYITSYKDLPVTLYQIGPKYRDEARAKSGILRGREFRMKDMYSFHASNEDFDTFYASVIEAYMKIFVRCGLENVKITEASGGDFSKKHSHEFNVITPAGEVDLYYCDGSVKALNEEVVKGNAAALLDCEASEVKQAKAIEIANIFDLGTRFSEAFNLKFVDEFGKKHLVTAGCYGIGTSRLLGAIAEIHHDEHGLTWPDEVRPFDAHLVGIAKDPAFAGLVYRTLKAEGFDVLYDDRDTSAGKKFVTADLVGAPIRLLVSDKTGDMIEWKERQDDKTYKLSIHEVIQNLKDYYS
jgi:prolyl-tRNA synthetase